MLSYSYNHIEREAGHLGFHLSIIKNNITHSIFALLLVNFDLNKALKFEVRSCNAVKTPAAQDGPEPQYFQLAIFTAF